MLIEDVPDPGEPMEVGLKVTVTPVGWPVAESATAESNPPEIVVVIVELPLLPSATETEAGEAAMVNAGLAVVGASVLINAAPLGLPHPVTRSYPVVAE